MSLSIPTTSVVPTSCFSGKDARRRHHWLALSNAATLAGQALIATRPFKARTTVKLRDLVVRSSVDPGSPPLPSDPSGSWKMWLLGVIVSVVLPFFSSKWGPLLKLKNEVEAVVEKAELVTETIEKVAEGVEKVAEEIEERLPEGGKLRAAVEAVDKVAKAAAKGAELAGDVIDKVEEVEKDVDSFMEANDYQKPGDAPGGST
ncbi:hypothetical protein MLD38_001019 [Melastoma candidum]|uniref:Uncharacterized protein n=1 Tax=Melastoma candidum TaxID=119954 RepID=A0ACB9SFU7_9MYRT|nr:hypothetical protein MLD38_001019 [Melastoma candidum]